MKKFVKIEFSMYEVNSIANNTKQYGLMFTQAVHCCFFPAERARISALYMNVTF